MPERPNILLIVFDTARADAFSPYNKECRTPAVAQLASSGVSMPRAIAPSCWTVPSHASMLLGAPPRSVGLSQAPGGRGELCAPVIEHQRHRYLPEVLRRAGYTTAAASANLWISKRNGFALGFDEFHDAIGERVSRMAQHGVRTRLRWYLDALRARADDGARLIESRLNSWSAEPARAPFFWFVNLIECHSPYLPPKPYNDRGPIARVLAAEDARRHQTLGAVLRTIATGVPPPASALRRMKHFYDRSIDLLDAWLARILELLDRSRLIDETIVIVTSDHGENFGENGLIGHGGSLDDRLLSVPLVLGGPGVRKTSTAGSMSLADLPRIIAGLVELDADPWGPIEDPGVAISQYDGAVNPDDPRAAVLHEWGATPEGFRRLTQRFTSATDGMLKLVRDGQGDRLFDTEVDPLESAVVDPSGYPADRVARLRAAVDRATAEGWDPDPDAIAPPPTSDEEAATIEERMRLLGYL